MCACREVLCVELMYLRVITGAADGKMRIWNMVTGQCLRILRGNSRSDPINTLLAIDNRLVPAAVYQYNSRVLGVCIVQWYIDSCRNWTVN